MRARRAEAATLAASAALRLLCLLCALLAIACGSEPARPPPAAPPASAPKPRIVFAYETLDGKPLSTETLAGRFSVIGFVTTYDLPSQAQVRFLSGLLRDHTPRINVAVLVLERAENRPLVEAFVNALRLPYPVALADAATIAGTGPFTGLHHVPSIVILDREGREVHRHLGLATEEQLDEMVRAAERAEDLRR